MLSELNIKNLRNINDVVIKPNAGLNLFIGENGSGKTSLLEAVHLLALGRSFRSRSLKNVVQFKQSQLQVTAKTQLNIPMGLQFDLTQGLQMRLNNAPLKKLSELAAQLPLQLIPANSHQFFEQGPRFRRQLLDWGLFHVEPSFNFHWQSYKKVVQQRNSAIRQHKQKNEIQLWDSHLISHGEKITEQRKQYLGQLLAEFKIIFCKLCPEYSESKFLLKYRSGWAKEQSLEQAIKSSITRDQQLGYTRSGSHAADWSFKIDGYEASDVFSRGQQKLFFFALCLAQLKTTFSRKDQANKSNGILLIDDISSELDNTHLAEVMKQIARLPVQTFISSTDAQLTNLLDETTQNVSVFHVEQGRLNKLR